MLLADPKPLNPTCYRLSVLATEDDEHSEFIYPCLLGEAPELSPGIVHTPWHVFPGSGRFHAIHVYRIFHLFVHNAQQDVLLQNALRVYRQVVPVPRIILDGF